MMATSVAVCSAPCFVGTKLGNTGLLIQIDVL
jgi:hypothetical protein